MYAPYMESTTKVPAPTGPMKLEVGFTLMVSVQSVVFQVDDAALKATPPKLLVCVPPMARKTTSAGQTHWQ